MDRSTFGGIVVAVVGLIVGLLLDGGNLAQVMQPTAALIVFGGTLGAVMVQFPMRTLRDAVASLKQVLLQTEPPSPAFAEELLRYAVKARRHGVVALDQELEDVDDAFLRKALTCAVDGMQMEELRETMEIDVAAEEDSVEASARVFEAAGGYAPTIGILGAVLGLIQVMQRLDNIGEVGKGIAVAFVATLYGVGSANLLFLPLAGKIRIRALERQLLRDLMLETALSIAGGLSPRALKQRLAAYLVEPARAKAVVEAPAQ
ncbi:MAG TPA: flagellar motor protein [Acidobacteriaceae bacterium]